MFRYARNLHLEPLYTLPLFDDYQAVSCTFTGFSIPHTLLYTRQNFMVKPELAGNLENKKNRTQGKKKSR